MKIEPIEGSETSAIRTKTPGNYPKENILQFLRKLPKTKYTYFFIFSVNFAWNIVILWKIKRDVIKKKCIGLHVQCPLLLSGTNESGIFFSIDFPKMLKFDYSPPSGSRVVPLGLADGRTDMTKLIVFFRNFVNALNTELLSILNTAVRKRNTSHQISLQNNDLT